jgi:hypothetical protein
MSTTSQDQKKEETKGVLEGAYDAVANAATQAKDTISHGWEATKAKFDETSAETSKETNKQTMKDSDKPIGDRIAGAASAAGDYVDQKSSQAKYETHKEAATR